jgi:predicted metal-dependent peptidase
MTEDLTGELNDLIARMVFSRNFAGYVFSNVRRIADENIPSIMGVGITSDGVCVLGYNPIFFRNTTESNRVIVIEHELLHLLNKHPIRSLRILNNIENHNESESRGKIFNIAADCTVNKQGNLPKSVIINGRRWPLLFSEMYNIPDDTTTEEKYLLLLEQAKKQSGGPGGEFNDSQNIDSHMGWTISYKDSPDKASLIRKADSHITNIIRESVKNFTKARGTLSGLYEELIQGALTPPQAPYYQIIQRYIRATKLSKFKRAFSKINKKRGYVFQDDIPIISPFPGRKRDFTFRIVVLLDTSGSMSPEEIKEGLSGVKHIIEKDKYCETTVLEVDTIVEKEYQVKKIRDIEFNIKGRSGTILGPGFFRARELNVDVCLTFTDAATEKINDYRRRDLPKKMIFVIPEEAEADTIKGLGPVVRIK